MSKNLILGMAEDLDWESLRPFVASLRRTGFSGELRLFTAGVSDSTRHHLDSEGVEVERFVRIRAKRRSGAVYQPLRSAHLTHLAAPLLRRTPPNVVAAISVPSVARFLRYYRFLAAAPEGRYENVMLTDVRDVYVQSDPFAFEIGTRVNCFLEDPRETLASQPDNRSWLVAAYGEPILDEIGSRPISCAGVTIGSRDAILAYLRVMVDALLRVPYQTAGICQAVHNYVIHTGLLPDVNLIANAQGPVLTLGIMPRAEVAAALPDGFADIRILHQYDRHPELAKLLLERLAPNDSE